MELFVRFRDALARYADGVHRLGDAAPPDALRTVEKRLGVTLPPLLRDLLSQWNGALLFHESVTLFGAPGTLDGLDGLATDGERLVFGEDAFGRLLLDGDGRVWSEDAETERAVIVGSSLARWLDAVMAREGVIYDREGEFREEAFDEGELSAKAARKRAETAIRADPDSPAWHHELALLWLEAGREEAAASELERAVSLDAKLADAWSTLGKLRRAHDDAAGAIDAFRRAAEAESVPEEAAFALAEAARIARSSEREGEADAIAARVLALDAPFVSEQKTAARHLVDEREFDAALERLELARAVAPSDGEVEQLVRLARARQKLRSVD